MPVGDLPGWQQICTDDFTLDVPLGSFPGNMSNKWWAYPYAWKNTSGNGTYYPSRVISVASGVMNLYIHTEGGVHMVSAPVPIIKTGSHTYGNGLLYGRYVIRFKSEVLPETISIM